ncbi:MAG: peptidoglycan recognition family protein [Candidatus Brocadiales bacterium]
MVEKRPPSAAIGPMRPMPKPRPAIPKEEVPSMLKLPYVHVNAQKWRYIVIHHSATSSGSADSFDHYHREKKGWDRGLGYHFVIGNGNGTSDGIVETGRRWIRQIDGAHAGSAKYNQHGIGICLVGNFEVGYPTSEQISSLVELVRGLQQICNIPSENIILHRHIRDTSCPGGNFSYYEVLAKLPR